MAERTQVIFATKSYDYMRDALVAGGGFAAGTVERKQFPDGEHYRRLVDDVAGRDVVVLGGTINDADTLELYDLAWGAAQYGANSLTIVVPYFGYSTMERAVRGGEVVTAKSRARVFSSLPSVEGGTRVVMIDLHSEGIPYYFEGDVRPVHLYARDVVLAAARSVGGARFVLGSTDSGRAKWVESLANELGVPAGFILKRRIDGSHTQVVALSADVQDAHVVLYDDMIRTGGSLLKAAEAYRESGASRVSVVATHGVFPAGAVAKLEASGLVDGVVVTDSHPAAKAHEGAFVRVMSVAPIIADYVARRVYAGSR